MYCKKKRKLYTNPNTQYILLYVINTQYFSKHSNNNETNNIHSFGKLEGIKFSL